MVAHSYGDKAAPHQCKGTVKLGVTQIAVLGSAQTTWLRCDSYVLALRLPERPLGPLLSLLLFPADRDERASTLPPRLGSDRCRC